MVKIMTYAEPHLSKMANCLSNCAGYCAVDLIELCENCAVNCAGLSFLQGLPIMQPGDEIACHNRVYSLQNLISEQHKFELISMG